MSISQHILSSYVWDVIYEWGYMIYSQKGEKFIHLLMLHVAGFGEPKQGSELRF